jgi:hypothetical protein
MAKDHKKYLLFFAQKTLLRTVYFAFLLRTKLKRNSCTDFDWVIGPQDVVNLIERLGKVLPNSFTVNLGNSAFFNEEYNYTSVGAKIRTGSNFVKLIEGPIVLGWLASKSTGFIYVGIEGFLIPTLDEREFEFSFLKKHKKKIVCVLTGTDIRSPKKSLELSKSIARDTFAEYQIWKDPTLMQLEYEESKRKYAIVIDEYSDKTFNWQFDQISYLKKPTFNLPYLCQNSYFKEDLSGKFEKIERLKIIHAPSDPIIKGTAVVRAVIEMLKSDGFDFEYIELMNTANSEVMKNLETAHILINQLYSLIPGILTIEALAHRCAVLTSVGERYESFGEGSNGAWISITPGTLYRELLNLFMNPELIKTQAAKGYDWAIANASEESGGKRLRELLRIN